MFLPSILQLSSTVARSVRSFSTVREGFFQNQGARFPAPENYGRFDTVAPEEKFPCVVQFEIVIVVFDLGMHFDFFEMRNMLFLFCFFQFLRFFIFKFSIVHYSANRRFRVGSDFNEVELFFNRPLKSSPVGMIPNDSPEPLMTLTRGTLIYSLTRVVSLSCLCS